VAEWVSVNVIRKPEVEIEFDITTDGGRAVKHLIGVGKESVFGLKSG
jgi:hypothetical protein